LAFAPGFLWRIRTGQWRGDTFGAVRVRILNFLWKKLGDGNAKDLLKPCKNGIADFGNAPFHACQRQAADVHTLALQLARQPVVRPLLLGTQIGHSAARDVLETHPIALLKLRGFLFDRESQSESASELFRWRWRDDDEGKDDGSVSE